MANIDPVKFLRRANASEYLRDVWGLRYAPSTLAKLSCAGTGPVEHRCGRLPLYTPQALDDWAMSRITPPAHRLPDPSSRPEASA